MCGVGGEGGGGGGGSWGIIDSLENLLIWRADLDASFIYKFVFFFVLK